jgi:hypothetical protein
VLLVVDEETYQECTPLRRDQDIVITKIVGTLEILETGFECRSIMGLN